MSDLGSPHRHFRLTNDMSRAVGINLSDQMHSGKLSRADYASMVTGCRQCACADACEAWLAQLSGPCDQAPDACVNRAQLGRLKTG